MKHMLYKLFWKSFWAKCMTIALGEIILQGILCFVFGAPPVHFIAWSLWLIITLCVRVCKREEI